MTFKYFMSIAFMKATQLDFLFEPGSVLVAFKAVSLWVNKMLSEQTNGASRPIKNFKIFLMRRGMWRDLQLERKSDHIRMMEKKIYIYIYIYIYMNNQKDVYKFC